MATARINHNAHLADIHRSMSVHQANTSKQIGMLSSGLRINRSSDDPASMALADGIRSEVRAIAEGTRNIQQTFSLIQVADGSLNEISAMVNRMHTLAMQGASSVFNDTHRLNCQSEFSALRSEIDRIAGATTYNGRELLTGGNNSLLSESTALADATNTGLTDVLVSGAQVSTYTFVDVPGDG
jgi:flagellin